MQKFSYFAFKHFRQISYLNFYIILFYHILIKLSLTNFFKENIKPIKKHYQFYNLLSFGSMVTTEKKKKHHTKAEKHIKTPIIPVTLTYKKDEQIQQGYFSSAQTNMINQQILISHSEGESQRIRWPQIH